MRLGLEKLKLQARGFSFTNLCTVLAYLFVYKCIFFIFCQLLIFIASILLPIANTISIQRNKYKTGPYYVNLLSRQDIIIMIRHYYTLKEKKKKCVHEIR